MKCKIITCNQDIRTGTPYCDEHCRRLVATLDEMFAMAEAEKKEKEDNTGA